MSAAIRRHGGFRRQRANRRLFVVVMAVTLLFVAYVAIFADSELSTAFGSHSHFGTQRATDGTAKMVRRLAPITAAFDAAGSLPQPMTGASACMNPIDNISGQIEASDLPAEKGVYAIFSVDGSIQYIGLSRNIAKSVAVHAEAFAANDVSKLISSVRYIQMPGVSKDVLKMTWERWIRDVVEDGGSIPPGNLPDDALDGDPRWRRRVGQSKMLLGSISSLTEAVSAVEKAVTDIPALLFMKGTPAMPQCGFSARVIRILHESRVPYETINVLDVRANPYVREAVKQYSKWPTIPQLFVRGELVGGADIITEMSETGQLLPKLKGAVSGENVSTVSSPTSQGSISALAEVNLVVDPMRPVASLMSRTLNERFKLYALRITDESSKHEGDVGVLEMGLTSETHFRVEIVAFDFEGLSPVDRQQMVFDALADVIPRVHAVSLVTKTPAEIA
eukprot:TRINITY_DN50716_c0_g1_i1.p1 TRINITY_DN50716_c0_g1~~TRINITY_DN50716_c0_g1_i1.p1  ORF type:complete len:475 (+),score=74.00 TRINITY_DN50716_c0_g1_i1:81-1427(+)